MVDRLMRFLDRAFFNGQYFHGSPQAAESRVRALALLWNFCPSSPSTVKRHHGKLCPAERLNGKRYAQSWLENLLVSGSMNGQRHCQQNPLQRQSVAFDTAPAGTSCTDLATNLRQAGCCGKCIESKRPP